MLALLLILSYSIVKQLLSWTYFKLCIKCFIDEKRILPAQKQYNPNKSTGNKRSAISFTSASYSQMNSTQSIGAQ